MDPLDPQFDDPALRKAIGRTLGGDTAPASLHSKVRSALDHEDRITRRWRKPLYALATAAVLLIGFGVAFLLLRSNDRPIPQFFAAAMVSAHDNYANTPANIKDSDLQTIRQKLVAQVGHPVLVSMIGDGWIFQGADIAKINNIPAAHLLFRRGDESISIFSIDARALYDSNVPDGTGYAQIQQGHPISGFVSGGAVHCLVGSPNCDELSLKELTRIRERLRPDVKLSQISAAPLPDTFAISA